MANNICAAACIDVCVNMCIDMSHVAGGCRRRVDMYALMCMDICVDMRTDMCFDMRIDILCRHVYRHVC